jgi:succinyl-CoA synthetase alpha subunit
MSILVPDGAKVIVQGITGREGVARTQLMLGYGTNIVGGCTPGRGGEEVEGLPVFDCVAQCMDHFGGVHASCLFIPAPIVKDAALEAIAAGVKLLVIVPDRVPVHDVLEIKAAADAAGASFLGPNTLGVLSPDRWVLGMMGGRADSARKFFKRGAVGVTSRSGGITSSIAYYLGQAGIGASTIVHVGGDSVVGLPHPEIVRRFEADDETNAIVMFGEIGGSQEEQVAELIQSGAVQKPLIAYIGGKGAKEGTRFSHAGAIIEGGRGTREGKVETLTAAGATVVEDFDRLPEVTLEVLKAKGISV